MCCYQVLNNHCTEILNAFCLKRNKRNNFIYHFEEAFLLHVCHFQCKDDPLNRIERAYCYTVSHMCHDRTKDRSVISSVIVAHNEPVSFPRGHSALPNEP